MASDDDNVRNRKEMLELRMIGTPSIIVALYKGKCINAEKAMESLNRLRKIGWFSSHIIDKISQEVD